MACVMLCWIVAAGHAQDPTSSSNPRQGEDSPEGAELAAAQIQFYSGRYEAAAATALAQIRADSPSLWAHELRSTALLFQIKRLIPLDTPDKGRALRECTTCADLIAAFEAATRAGLDAARGILKADAANIDAQFVLGKLDLNHVWLYLGTLGRKTGWNEYWEGRRAIEAVLAREPNHLRARVAWAWIDYIVATKMAPGTRWILGGGNKKRAMAAMRDATAHNDDSFAGVEARFAVWDLHVREKNVDGALRAAHALAKEFPENPDILAFLDKHDRSAKP